MRSPILVTGAAGFIGFHLAHRLLAEGHAVVGLDNLNAYYDPGLKKARLKELAKHGDFHFEACELADRERLDAVFAAHAFAEVVHLAAQAGVRHSIDNPHVYGEANLLGFLNLLEGCRRIDCRHLLYASSSSVYGANTRLPWRASDDADHPLSLYGATKRANELMTHAYAHLFNIPATGLRFFTVYGPWGRPDMAMWLFTDAILRGKPIRLFNHGRMRRDFTYVDDAIEAVVRLLPRPPAPDPSWAARRPDPASSNAPWRVYNIGNSQPIELDTVVGLIERTLDRRAVRELLPMQPGDVVETCADCTDLEQAVGYKPATPIEDGILAFVDWFRDFHRVK